MVSYAGNVFTFEVGEKEKLVRNNRFEKPSLFLEGAPYFDYFLGERHFLASSEGDDYTGPIVIAWKSSGRALAFTRHGQMRYHYHESLVLEKDHDSEEHRLKVLADVAQALWNRSPEQLKFYLVPWSSAFYFFLLSLSRFDSVFYSARW